MFANRKHRKTEARLAVEILDRRDVPAAIYLPPTPTPATPARVPFVVQPTAGFVAGRLPIGTQGPNGPINTFAGRATPANPTSSSDFPYGPGGYYAVVNSPSGPYGVRGPIRPVQPTSRPVVTPTAAVRAEPPSGATSARDFPYGPGGYYAVVNSPSGPFGVR